MTTLLLALLACADQHGGNHARQNNQVEETTITDTAIDTGIPVKEEEEDRGDRYDDDGDGYNEEENDCNDADPTINPGAREICDGIDNDCSTVADEYAGAIYYPDEDGDECYNTRSSIIVCDDEEPPEGWLPIGFLPDCNDNNPNICEC